MEHAFSLSTDLWLDPTEGTLEVVTEARNTGSEPIRMVKLGDHVAWPGGVPVAPRMGEVRGPTTALLPWFARSGETTTFALAFPDASAEVEFKFDENGLVAQLALSPAVELGPGSTARYRRSLIVVDGGLGPVAEIAWHTIRQPVGRVKGILKPPPAWATLRALSPDGRTVMQVESDAHGEYDLPLPRGNFQIALKASG